MAYNPSELYIAVSYPDRYNLKRWHYFTTDNEATVEAEGYFSDFLDRGGKVGEEIFLYRYTTALPERAAPPLGTATSSSLAPPPTTVVRYIVNAITAAGAATLSANVDTSVVPPPPPPI